MLNCKDIMIYMRDLFKVNNVYDCARPFLHIFGIFGIGGNQISETGGVRSTRFSLLITVFTAVFITPAYFIALITVLFFGKQRTLYTSTMLIIEFGRHSCMLFTISIGYIQTRAYYKSLTKVFQILNNTDRMLKEENIKTNYWKIIMKTILFGLISFNYLELYAQIHLLSLHFRSVAVVFILIHLFSHIASNQFFMWTILFLLLIRERFIGINKLLHQNAQVSYMRDSSLLRRISLARDIHEQLSEAIVLFSDISRVIIVGFLIPSVLDTFMLILSTVECWDMLSFSYWEWVLLQPIFKIVILTGVCETHKNNRQVLTSKLRYLISVEQDRRIVHQLKQYILYNHITVAGLVDFQLIDIDFTLLFMIIDIIISYALVIYSHFRP